MIAPLLLLAAAASSPAAAAPPARPAATSAPAPAAEQPVALPRCRLTPGAQYGLHLSAATGSRLEIQPEGPIALKAFALYKEDLLREGTREYRVEIDWLETIEARAEGGYRLSRKITAAKVARTVAGVAEGGPLPIDYEGSTATIELDAHCAGVSRKFESSRLPKPEQETLAQMLELEPMAAPPETLAPGAEFIREQNDPPTFVTDHYSLAAPQKRPAAGGPASGPLRLQLLRSVAIREDNNPQFVPLTSPHPGVYFLEWCADGLPRTLQGGYELTMRETVEAPPELIAASPAPPPEKNKKPKTQGAPGSAPAPAAAAPAAPRILIDYFMPSTYALSRRPLNAEAKQGDACP